MNENFETIYEQLKKEFGKKYEPKISNKNTKKALYIFMIWIILSTIEYIVRLFNLSKTSVGLILKLSNTITIFVLIFYIFYIMNKNFEYWKTAYSFKKEVGIKFWKILGTNSLYITEISQTLKKEIENNLNEFLSQKINALIIEDGLKSENFDMYTIKFDDENKKRFNGVFCRINKQINLTKEDLKNSQITKTSIIQRKTYVLLDAIEIFKFSNTNFFNKNELYKDYIIYKEIENIVSKNSL